MAAVDVDLSKFTGFSKQTADGTYVINNKPLLYMIDWIGVYGSLLDLVRRIMLAAEVRDGEAPSDWPDVHEGWVLFFQGTTLNNKMKDIPQFWLDLCPAAETREAWAARYREIVKDDSGEAIKDTVLWVKERAARGLAFAGELARRGFGETEYKHKTVRVDTQKKEDVFVRQDKKEVDDSRLASLRQLLVTNAPAFAQTLRVMNNDDDDKRADWWDSVAETRGDVGKLETIFPKGLLITSLIARSIRPLVHSRALSPTDAAAVTDALTVPGSPGRARDTISLTHELFTAYVSALMTFYFRTQKDIEAPGYPTAPRNQMISSIRATAAADEQEPEDSFLGISLDREAMRNTLLKHIEAERRALEGQMMKAYGERAREARKQSPASN